MKIKNTKIINLTPHPLNIYKKGELVKTIESSGIARAEEETVPVLLDAFIEDDYEDPMQMTILGVPVVKKQFGKVIGLPEPQPNVYYFVSKIVIYRSPERSDLIMSSKAVRDQSGQTIGCEEFSVL